MCFEEYKCEELVSTTYDCGHTTQGKCCDIENSKCQIKVYSDSFIMNLFKILIFGIFTGKRNIKLWAFKL